MTLAKKIEAHGLTELDWFIDGLLLLGNKDDEDDEPAKDDEDNEPARKKARLRKPCKPSRPASPADSRLDQNDEQPDKKPDEDERSDDEDVNDERLDGNFACVSSLRMFCFPSPA